MSFALEFVFVFVSLSGLLVVSVISLCGEEVVDETDASCILWHERDTGKPEVTKYQQN